MTDEAKWKYCTFCGAKRAKFRAEIVLLIIKASLLWVPTFFLLHHFVGFQ